MIKHPPQKKRFLRRMLCTVFAAATLTSGCSVVGFGQDEGNDLPPDTSATVVDPPTTAPTTTPTTVLQPTDPATVDAFGQVAVKDVPQNDPFGDNWNDMLTRHVADMQTPQDAEAYENFMSQFDDFRNEDLYQKASDVNKLVTQEVTYTKDDVLYGSTDYWAAPAETAMQLKGDCEDYAILQYYILRDLGVPASRLFVVAVNAEGQETNADHAFLLMNVAPDGAPEQFVILNDAAPVIAADNSIVSKTWINPDTSIPQSYVLFDARNEEGFWRTANSSFATGAKSAPAEKASTTRTAATNAAPAHRAPAPGQG